MDNVDTRRPPEGIAVNTLPTRFAAVAQLAAQHARNEAGRLDIELLRNKVQVRVSDQIEVASALLRIRPYSAVAWKESLDALINASRMDEARAAVARIPAEAIDDDPAADMIASVARVDVAAALAMVRRTLAKPSPSAAALYQAHRIFLYTGLVDEAAEIARRFTALQSEPALKSLLLLRQACAEGRVADAEALYALGIAAGAYYDEVVSWLALSILGRDDEARERVRPLDEASTLYLLSRLLSYTHFDPRPYPNLSKVLVAQGVQRETLIPIPYACKR
jgi:tetratricopeptide (TPR) repeat protein